MTTQVLLTADQIQELKLTVNRLLQDNISTFPQIYQRKNKFKRIQTNEQLFNLATEEFTQKQNMMNNLSRFTFSVMDSFESLWDQVHFRDNKILELRHTLASATNCIDELTIENDFLKEKLTQAETQIQWIEEEKQYLDALYDQSSTSNQRSIKSSQRSLNRAYSQKNISSGFQKKNVNYEKLKLYIEALRVEKTELEQQYCSLLKKYQIKKEQCKKNTLFIEYLAEKNANNAVIRQKSDEFNGHEAQLQQDVRNQYNSEEFQKFLERTSNQITYSLKDNINQDEIVQWNGQTFESVSNLNQFSSENDKDQHFVQTSMLVSPKNKRYFHDSSMSFMLEAKEIGTQTESIKKSATESLDYQISINIKGIADVDRREAIKKIVSNLNFEKELKNNLNTLNEKKIQKQFGKRKGKDEKAETQKQKSMFEYYMNRIVANRIKKYPYLKPFCFKPQLLKSQ